MIALLFFLWLVTAILLITDYKSESTRWLSATTFLSGLGGLTVVLKENVIPYLEAGIIKNPIIIDIFRLLCGVSASLAHYVAPYAFLIYSIIFSEIHKEQWEKHRVKVILILSLPVLFMYALYSIYPVFNTSYLILSFWVSLYVLSANFLLIYSSKRTKRTAAKQQKMLTSAIIIPATTMSLITNYLLPAFNLKGVYIYNTGIIIFQFSIFLFFAVKRGALGVKLTVEKQRLDRTLKALTSGTVILNHTIKNEVSKISLCMNNIQNSTAYAMKDMPETLDVNENIEIVNDSIKYLSVMINRIQNQVKEIVLEECQNNLGNIIDKAVNMVLPYLKSKNIDVSKNYGYDLNIICDCVHLQETFSNILNNSIEAIGSNGEVNIDIYENKKFITVTVKDNGTGISKENLLCVLDPFFSTKHRTQNFGMGLSYCYNVMQQHGGSLEVQSEEGYGTTVLLRFPAKRIAKELNKKCKLELNVHG
jgi:signal transduction histidine kinase